MQAVIDFAQQHPIIAGVGAIIALLLVVVVLGAVLFAGDSDLFNDWEG